MTRVLLLLGGLALAQLAGAADGMRGFAPGSLRATLDETIAAYRGKPNRRQR